MKSWVHIFCNGAIFFFSLADIGRDSDMFDFRYENPVKSQIIHFDFQLNHFHTMLPIYDSASNTAKMNKSTKKISWMQRSELLNSLLWKCTFFFIQHSNALISPKCSQCDGKREGYERIKKEYEERKWGGVEIVQLKCDTYVIYLKCFRYFCSFSQRVVFSLIFCSSSHLSLSFFVFNSSIFIRALFFFSYFWLTG